MLFLIISILKSSETVRFCLVLKVKQCIELRLKVFIGDNGIRKILYTFTTILLTIFGFSVKKITKRNQDFLFIYQ